VTCSSARSRSLLPLLVLLLGPGVGPRARADAPDPRAAMPSAGDSSRRSSRAAPGDEGDEAARELLRQAIDLYMVGRYRDAADRLRPLVETRVLRDRADQGEALRAYGVSLFLIGARAGAERTFRDLLRLESGAHLDPSFVRPEVVGFFEEVRRRHQAEADELLRRRGPRGPASVNLLPPWGQFRNGHRTKGYFLLGTELSLAATSVVTAALLYSWQGDTKEFSGHEDAYPALSKVNAISFGVLVGVLIYGVVDGLYYYYRAPPQRGPGSGVVARLGALDHSGGLNLRQPTFYFDF